MYRTSSIHFSMAFIIYQRLVRLVRVGRFLFLTATSGLLFSFYFTVLGIPAWMGETGMVQWMGNMIMGLYSGMTALFALLDARSRYQDYKRAKDLFFENGFKPRIAHLFIHSKCQRDAVRVAACDLGLLKPLEQYYRDKGYRWYHILPDFVFKRPWIVLTWRYWRKTLFTPGYDSVHFLW